MPETLSKPAPVTPTRTPALHGPALADRKVNRRTAAKLTAAVLAMLASGCSTAKVTRRHSTGDVADPRPQAVYVADFDLEPAGVQSEPNLWLPAPELPGLGDWTPPLPGRHTDPKKRARQLVEEMSATLVNQLNKDGLTARRLAVGEPFPESGWLVRGVFTTVDQGNQLQRAVSGFGKGRTQIQVVVGISDLSTGFPRSLYEIATTADSGKAPGAGPALILGPAGLAARFVIAGRDLERNVRQTASLIADEVVRRTAPGSVSTLAASE